MPVLSLSCPGHCPMRRIVESETLACIPVCYQNFNLLVMSNAFIQPATIIAVAGPALFSVVQEQTLFKPELLQAISLCLFCAVTSSAVGLHICIKNKTRPAAEDAERQRETDESVSRESFK